MADGGHVKPLLRYGADKAPDHTTAVTPLETGARSTAPKKGWTRGTPVILSLLKIEL